MDICICIELMLNYYLLLLLLLLIYQEYDFTDYVLKLKIIDELSNKINESDDDKKAIKNSLEALQDECSKLTYKLKTSAKLFDTVQKEREKLEVVKENMVNQIGHRQVYFIIYIGTIYLPMNDRSFCFIQSIHHFFFHF